MTSLSSSGRRGPPAQTGPAIDLPVASRYPLSASHAAKAQPRLRPQCKNCPVGPRPQIPPRTHVKEMQANKQDYTAEAARRPGDWLAGLRREGLDAATPLCFSVVERACARSACRPRLLLPQLAPSSCPTVASRYCQRHAPRNSPRLPARNDRRQVCQQGAVMGVGRNRRKADLSPKQQRARLVSVLARGLLRLCQPPTESSNPRRIPLSPRQRQGSVAPTGNGRRATR